MRKTAGATLVPLFARLTLRREPLDANMEHPTNAKANVAAGSACPFYRVPAAVTEDLEAELSAPNQVPLPSGYRNLATSTGPVDYRASHMGFGLYLQGRPVPHSSGWSRSQRTSGLSVTLRRKRNAIRWSRAKKSCRRRTFPPAVRPRFVLTRSGFPRIRCNRSYAANPSP